MSAKPIRITCPACGETNFANEVTLQVLSEGISIGCTCGCDCTHTYTRYDVECMLSDYWDNVPRTELYHQVVQGRF